MPGLFSAIDTMSSALQAFQQQLNVTGNNIANVNTPGYAREVATLQEAPQTNTSTGAEFTVGNGVSVATVSRIQSMFLQQQSQNASSDTGRMGTMSDGLTAIQGTLNEPGTSGVSDALSQFFNAWSGLASSPSDSSQQLQVQTAANTLTQRVQNLYQSLTTQSTQATTSVKSILASIQTDVNNIASLNDQIHLSSAIGSQPPGLLDQRDNAIQDLSKLVDVQTQANSDGTVNVSMNGMTLVDQSGAHQFPTNYNATNSTVTNALGVAFPIRSGELSGQFGILNAVVGFKSQLDTLANTVTTQVNNIYASGTNAAGATNQPFFTVTIPAGGAATFSVTPAIAASSSAIATGTTGNSGDGSVALSLSQLQSQSLPSLGGQTIQAYYTNFIGAVGTQTKYYQNQVTTQAAVTTQIQNQVQSLSGVSTDDELSNMLKFQQSYQAAAHALSTISSTMDSLLAILQ